MGRTARGVNGRGHALLILRPEELGFLRYLKQAKVTISNATLSSVQKNTVVESDFCLNDTILSVVLHG